MTEQLNRHPHRHVEPYYPLDGMLSITARLITAPIRGLLYVERSLKGTYTTSQDFFSRYQWTKHHVEDLHKSLASPNFWIKWSREGSATYIEIQSELATLDDQREKAYAIYQRQRYYRGRPTLRDLSTRAIACTDLTPIGKQLHDIHLRTAKASGQSYIDKKQKDATEIETSIETLKNTPVESSWEAWLLKHQTTCQAIESNILGLNHTTYLYVDTQEKLEGINTGDLNTLLYNALVDIAKIHYTSHAQKEYHTLYESAQKKLKALQEDRTTYHNNSWGNYLWSNWEKDHRQDADTLHTQLCCLRHLHDNLATLSTDSLSALQPLQKTFQSLFRSYNPPETHSPFRSSIPSTWKHHPHRGSVIHTGEPHLTNTLQLAFSDPKLAAQTTTENRQLEHLYHQFLSTTWNIQWDALYQLITKPTPQKPTHPYQQFIATYQKLTPTHPVYPLRSVRLNRETIFSNQTSLTLECASAQTQEERVPADTLETLLAKHSDAPLLSNPPEFLIINLQRTRETLETPIGLQEEFFLLPTHTTSHKGAAYELISFTSADSHYRKNPFGYTRINHTVQQITQLDFLIAAQTASTCVFRRSDINIPELELFQRAQHNRLRFNTLQFKMSAIHAIHGQSTFKIPESHQTTFQHLVDFIQCVTKAPSMPEHMFGKNPNDDLERAFQKLPNALRTFLLNTLQVPSKNPALLRDLRTHLLTSEESLSIPPIAGQQQHDVDRFVLTLIADRLVKHFGTHVESILKNEEQTFLLQATLHAVSQSVRAKKRRIIRYSAAAEETIQLTVTLVFSNYLEKGEEFLIRQAISSGTRLITVMGDPLQEHRLFQTAMRTATAMILLGQSLDNPELSDQDVTNTMRQFFARQGIALISLESVPQPVKDLAIATLSSAIFRSPSHLISWGVSTTFTLINTALVDDLPPDVPQSNLNFYRARILNPLLTNAALHAFATEKVTQAGLRLLRSLEDSDHTTEDLTPTIPIEEAIAEAPLETQEAIDHLPKPHLVHDEYYVDTRDSFRVYDNQSFEGDDYGKFNSQEEAQKFIRELKSVEVSDNNRKLALYNLKVKALHLGVSPEKLPADPHFTKIRLALEVTSDSVKLYKGPQRVFKVSKSSVKKEPKRFEKGITEVRKHAHTHNVTNDELLQTFESKLHPLLPAHIMAPEPIQKAFPIIKHTNTVCTLTPSGEVADRVTFSTRDQAESIRTFHAGHDVDLHQCQTMRFEMEKQAVQQGASIESLPKSGPFVQTPLQVEAHGSRHFSLRVNDKTHTFTGKDAFTQLDAKLSHYRTADRGANQRTLNQHQTQLSSLTNAPITQTKPTPSERSLLMDGMLPPVKTEKEHGAWFRGWRSAQATGSKGVQWLRDIGLAGASVDVVQTDFNAPKPTNSTPSYAGAYGPDVARTSSTPAPSQTHSAATPSPVEKWGWQDVEEMQQHKVLDALENAINTNRQTFSGMPQAPIDYQTLWGEGVGPEVQFPPMEISGLGRSEASDLRPSHGNLLQMAGLLPFVMSKVVPEQTKIKVETWVNNYIQQWKDDPIAARKTLDLCLLLGAKKGVVIAIQAFEQPSLKTKPNTVGLMEVSDRFDNWFAQKVNIDLTSPNAQMGMFIGEFAMPIPLVGAFKNCTKVGKEAFVFMRQSAKFMKPQPLFNRALAFPQGFGQQVRAIEALQQPVYRSGFASEKAVQQARKAVNLPAFKKMKIKINHAASGHLSDGYRAMCKGSKKTVFPEGTTKEQLEIIIEHAYKNCKKVRTQQGERYKVLVRGKYEGMEVEMWVNTRDKIIETAYPRPQK